MTSKVCFKCKCEKPLGEFYKHSRMADGHLNKCKECARTDASNHRTENIERVREYDKSRANQPRRIEQRKAIVANWCEAHKDRKDAQTKVSNAIRDGKLSKLPCLVCGSEKSEGHHPDYSRPLDVVWLCRPHHIQAHALVRNI